MGEHRKIHTLRITVALGFIERFRGLMFRANPPELGTGLLFLSTRSIHTCWLRFTIDLLYLDHNGVVCKIVKNLRPWSANHCKTAQHTVELAAYESERLNINRGDAINLLFLENTR